jgi:PAS domain S-box-containing protein
MPSASDRQIRDQALGGEDVEPLFPHSYRALVERIPGIVYCAAMGEHGAWLYASPQVEELFGYTPGQWCSDPSLWFEHIHPEDRERALADEAASRSTGHLSSEYRMITRDGHVIWFQDRATLVRDHPGAPPYFQGVMLDVSDRKRAETQLQAVIDNSPALICAKDRGYRYLFVNREFSRLVGVDAAEVVGQTDMHLFPTDVVARLRELDGRVIVDGGAFTVEEELPCRNGQRTFVTQRFPLRDAEGAVYAVCAIATDVTAIKTSNDRPFSG